MKVVVFGAAGRTGRLLVQGALERGHEVTALLRAPDELAPPSELLHVALGDVLDGGAVSDAVDGQQAALVALADAPDGSGSASGAAPGTLNVVRSMQRYAVRRVVVLSSSFVAPPGAPGRPGLLTRLLDAGARGRTVADLRRLEVTVRQSELGWTLVRAARLTDGPGRGGCRSGPGYALPGSRAIARADVAAFMLDQLERDADVGHAVAISS